MLRVRGRFAVQAQALLEEVRFDDDGNPVTAIWPTTPERVWSAINTAD